jgi:hypothetical protein
MPKRKPTPKSPPKSQAQAQLLGVIAGTKVRELKGQAATAYRKGLTKKKARSLLRGVPVHELPPRLRPRKK